MVIIRNKQTQKYSLQFTADNGQKYKFQLDTKNKKAAIHKAKTFFNQNKECIQWK